MYFYLPNHTTENVIPAFYKLYNLKIYIFKFDILILAVKNRYFFNLYTKSFKPYVYTYPI